MVASVRALLLLPLFVTVACSGSGSAGDASGTSGGVIAEVSGQPITEADLDARLAQIPGLSRPEFSGPVGKERLLEQMIEERILYRAAMDDGLDQDEDIQRRLEELRRSLLVQSYLDRMRDRAAQVTEKEARAFYQEHQDDYVVAKAARVRVLVNPDRKIMNRAREMVVDQGVRFPLVCSRFNTVPALIENAGLLPNWVVPGRSVSWIGNQPRFHEVVFSLEPGVPSEVFEIPQGLCLVMVDELRPERQRPFDEVRTDVESRIARERTTTGLPELIAELKERYDVRILAPPGRSAEELFDEAQGAAEPQRKVDLFEELVRRHPDDSRVLEALFMIGFTKSEELGDEDGARVAFERVIRDFPDSELAQSAQWMLSSKGDDVPAFEDDTQESQE